MPKEGPESATSEQRRAWSSSTPGPRGAMRTPGEPRGPRKSEGQGDAVRVGTGRGPHRLAGPRSPLPPRSLYSRFLQS